MSADIIHIPKLQQRIEALIESPTLREGLTGIFAESHFPTEKSIDLAEEIIRLGMEAETPTAIRPCTMAAMHRFYQKELAHRDPETRVGILERMVFAMEVYADPARFAQTEAGIPAWELFPEDRDTDSSLDNEMRLRDRLLEQMEGLSLSPQSMKEALRRLSEDHFYISNAALLAWESLCHKCAAALYLTAEKGHTPRKAMALAREKVPFQLYPLERIAAGIRLVLIGVTIAAILWLTGLFLESCDFSLFWAEFTAVVTGICLYDEMKLGEERLLRAMLSLLGWKRSH